MVLKVSYQSVRPIHVMLKKRVTINSLLCVNCRKWTHEQCTKWKNVTSVLTQGFVCKRCKMMMRNEMSVERLNDDVETVEGFCFLANALNASGGSVVTRSRIK